MSKSTLNRWYTAILYREDNNFQTYFNNIKNLYNNVVYIIHNKDINEDGTTKKEHMHVLFCVGENARHLKTIAKEIGIAENYLQGCNKNNMLLYLIHYRNEEKTQYKIEDVKGERKLIEKLKSLTKKEQDTEEIIKELIEEVKKGHILSITRLLEYSIENGIYYEVKRNQLLLCKLVEEQKEYYRNIKNKKIL